jgi:hypothetical protein
VIKGFTLTNGAGTVYKTIRCGGGIACIDSSPTIMRNIITGNFLYLSSSHGGGIHTCYGSPLIEANVIHNNCASSGGGITLWSAFPIVRNNTITNNTADEGGGVLCADTGILEDNTIAFNEAGTGGGVYLSGEVEGHIFNNWIYGNLAHYGGGINVEFWSKPILRNNFIINNSCTISNGYGGGIHVNFNSYPSIINNTFYGNFAANGGGALCIRGGSYASSLNNIFWYDQSASGNEICLELTSYGPGVLTIDHSIVMGGKADVHVGKDCTLNWGNSVHMDDPLFVNTTHDDFHVMYFSPCKDAGDDSVPGLPPFDFEKDPRIADASVDIGADEFHRHLYFTGDAAPGGFIQGKLVGHPETTPVTLFIGSEILTPPMPTSWGAFHLKMPWIMTGPLGEIPASGVMILSALLPINPPGPYKVPMQALIGLNPDSLTNVCVLEVR